MSEQLDRPVRPDVPEIMATEWYTNGRVICLGRDDLMVLRTKATREEDTALATAMADEHNAHAALVAEVDRLRAQVAAWEPVAAIAGIIVADWDRNRRIGSYHVGLLRDALDALDALPTPDPADGVQA